MAWLRCGDIGDFKLDLRDILDWLIANDSGDVISISAPTLGFDARRICRRGLLNEDLLETISSLRGDVARCCCWGAELVMGLAPVCIGYGALAIRAVKDFGAGAGAGSTSFA